jgi:hypothetical protein
MPTRASPKDSLSRFPKDLCSLWRGNRCVVVSATRARTRMRDAHDRFALLAGWLFMPKALIVVISRKRGGGPMKTKASWKPLGHSAKRWHGMTLRKDATTPRETRSQKKRGFSASPVWK